MSKEVFYKPSKCTLVDVFYLEFKQVTRNGENEFRGFHKSLALGKNSSMLLPITSTLGLCSGTPITPNEACCTEISSVVAYRVQPNPHTVKKNTKTSKSYRIHPFTLNTTLYNVKTALKTILKQDEFPTTQLEFVFVDFCGRGEKRCCIMSSKDYNSYGFLVIQLDLVFDPTTSKYTIFPIHESLQHIQSYSRLFDPPKKGPPEFQQNFWEYHQLNE
jgi:hypothetical protein